MKIKDRAVKITEILNENYGTEMRCYLNHENPWQLLMATILSAQCTDARVNMVTKPLFEKYNGPKELGNASISEVEEIIKSCGLYKNKAKNLVNCSKEIQEKYNGQVPGELEALTKLPGVGRKTANVIRGNCFNEASIVVDTHVKRVSRLLGLTKNEDPVKIEQDLMKVLPKKQWILYNLQIIEHGRKVCIARKPKCEECCLKNCCKAFLKR